MTTHPAAAHDVGGRPAGAVERDEHEHALWERRVDDEQVVSGELRRTLEALGPSAYETMGYSERWVAALASAMNERGVVTSGELGRRMAQVEQRA